MLVDSHCHLDFPDFAEELDAVVERAGEAGIGMMLTIGTRLSTFDRVLAVAERFPNVWCTVGIHPNEAANEEPTSVERLLELAQHPKVVGFGETGLDYFYEYSGVEAQQRNFRIHIEAAREAGLPVVIHTRDADADTARILREETDKGPFKALLHCFSSSQQLADEALELGLYISISGIVTFKKAEALKATVTTLPLDRLLVETDAPYLAPIPFRGKRNEPAYTAHTAQVVADLQSIPLKTLAAATTANFLNLFTKVPRPVAAELAGA